jgi:homopolymeric O-antigen transport system ATP-binding protein
MSDIAVSVRSVAKCYQVFENQRARLLHALWPAHRNAMQEVWALKDIDFEIRRGESVAVIGRNGSGKSTLLEILTGTLTPTAGDVTVNGRVSALLELGSGFNPEYTGRDNVMLNGLLLGLAREEITRRFDEITAFAEIGDALERPVKTYSSGMMMRLAFAVQVLTDPDILIIDEALSVGDFFFQQKCAAHIREMQRRGVTILFVSHDMGMVRNICTRAIYLRAGELVFVGDADRATLLYFQEGAGSPAASAEKPANPGEPGVENSKARPALPCLWEAPARDEEDGLTRILSVDFQDARGRQATSFRIGDSLRVLVAVENLRVGCAPAITIKNSLGQVVNVTYFAGASGTDSWRRVLFAFDIELALEAGRYGIQAYVGERTAPNVGSVVDETPALGPISIEWNYESEPAPFYGMFGLPAKVSAESLEP